MLSVAWALRSRPRSASPPRGALQAFALARRRRLFRGLDGLRAPVTTRGRPRPPHHAIPAIARGPSGARRASQAASEDDDGRRAAIRGGRFTTPRRRAYGGRRTLRDARAGERRSGAVPRVDDGQ